jgi:DNA-binding MarR family transcriptional regulator
MFSAMSSDSRPILPGESRDERPNIGILLRAPSQEVVRLVSEGLAEAGFDDIRPAHTVVFQHIKAEGSRLSELAERAQLTKQSMGYLVDHLDQRGYLERRPDPTDRRAALICLTERGWDEIRAALAIIAEIEEEWARRLGKRRMAQLRELLAELGRTTPEQPAPGPQKTTTRAAARTHARAPERKP